MRRHVFSAFASILVVLWVGNVKAQRANEDGAQRSGSVSKPPRGSEVRPAARPSAGPAGERTELPTSVRPAEAPKPRLLPATPRAPRGFGNLPTTDEPENASSTQHIGAGALGEGIAMPFGATDLVLEGPLVVGGQAPLEADPNVVQHTYSHSWIVTNAGENMSHSTVIRFECEDNYGNHGQAFCAGGQHNWPRTLQVPPLPPGASFTATSSDYGKEPVTIVFEMGPESSPEEPNALQPHWLLFSATVDPDEIVIDSNRENNTRKALLANMTPPLEGLELSASKPQNIGAAAQTMSSDGAVSVSDAAKSPSALQFGIPRYSIDTEDPWSPGMTIWVLVENTATLAAPESSVDISCVNHNAHAWNQLVDDAAIFEGTGGPPPRKEVSEECFFAADEAVSVPPLAPGQIHPLIQISTPEMDTPEQFGGYENGIKFGKHSYTLTFRGPAGEQLVLSTEPVLAVPPQVGPKLP